MNIRTVFFFESSANPREAVCSVELLFNLTRISLRQLVSIFRLPIEILEVSVGEHGVLLLHRTQGLYRVHKLFFLHILKENTTHHTSTLVAQQPNLLPVCHTADQNIRETSTTKGHTSGRCPLTPKSLRITLHITLHYQMARREMRRLTSPESCPSGFSQLPSSIMRDFLSMS